MSLVSSPADYGHQESRAPATAPREPFRDGDLIDARFEETGRDTGEAART